MRFVRGGPAYEAGLNVDDEIIALDEDRILRLEDDLRGRLPGTEVSVLVARRRRLLRVPVTLGRPQYPERRTKIAPRRALAQRRNLEALLTPR